MSHPTKPLPALANHLEEDVFGLEFVQELLRETGRDVLADKLGTAITLAHAVARSLRAGKTS